MASRLARQHSDEGWGITDWLRTDWTGWKELRPRLWPGKFVNDLQFAAYIIEVVIGVAPTGAGLLDCWEWRGHRDTNGYARLGTGRFGTRQVSRIVWMLVHRELLPRSRDIDHLCHNPPCVNPLHLEAVTHVVNMQRRRPKPKRTHCPKGHRKFEKPDGTLECRVCIKLATEQWMAKDGNRERQNKMRAERRALGR